MEQIQRTETARFERETLDLIKKAETHRISFMNAFKKREMLTAIVGIFSVFAFGCGFGYFLYIQADPLKAIASIVLAFAIPITMHIWSRGPISSYVGDYKKTFMPEMARALGGFKFHPSRGISSKILPKTGVVPAHDTYKAEDCFIGVYKGIKVILSEAKLINKNKVTFDGVFVLLDVPNAPFTGHTIITSDSALIAECDGKRWKSLTRIQNTVQAYQKFSIYTNQPETNESLIGETLLKELDEAGTVFDNAPITAVFFNKKYVFIRIPYDGDMFEASSIYLPVSSPDHADTCRREIEQILEIIDVFDLYRKAE